MHIGTFLGCAKYLLLLRFPVLRHFVRTPPYPFLLKGYVSGDGLIHHPPPRAALGRVTASHRWCKGWLEGCFEPKADAIGHDDMGNVFHPSSLPHFISSCNAHRDFSGMREVPSAATLPRAPTFCQNTSISIPFEGICLRRWLDPSPSPTSDDGANIAFFLTRDLSTSSLLSSS